MFMDDIAGVRVLYTGDYSREEDCHLCAAEIPQFSLYFNYEKMAKTIRRLAEKTPEVGETVRGFSGKESVHLSDNGT